MLGDELAVEAELGRQGADLVLEQLAERLDQLNFRPFGQAPDIVVRLDRRRRALDRNALDDVRVKRALAEKPHAADFRASASNTSMKRRRSACASPRGVTFRPAEESVREASTRHEIEVPATRPRTSSHSPFRSTPLSTNTLVSWSPTARWTISAVTAESTPPEAAQHPVPADAAAYRETADRRSARPSSRASAASRTRKFLRTLVAPAACGPLRDGTGRRTAAGTGPQ